MDDLDHIPEETTGENPELKTPNTVPFPIIPEPDADEAAKNSSDEDPQHHDQPQRSVRFKGTYKGMTAALALNDQSDTNSSKVETDNDDGGYFNCCYNLPPDCAMVGHTWLDPQMLDEALRGPNAKEWQAALDYEINQLQKFGTWVIEDLPKGQTAIPCSEVLLVKQGPSGEVQSYRVRIVAGGHKQVEGVNYTETFSAAAKMPTVQAVLANAAHQNWEIEHIDVKSTYLNAPLSETIYMKPLRGVLKPGEEGKVLRLLKGLYGLKQGGEMLAL